MDKEERSESTGTIFIASYGTLRTGFGNNAYMRGGNTKSLGLGKTDEKYNMYASGIPFVTKDGDQNITVEVFEVPLSDLAPIDSLEGHPRWYRREEVGITMDDGTKLNAWLYFMPDESVKRHTLVESGDFADYGRRVAR